MSHFLISNSAKIYTAIILYNIIFLDDIRKKKNYNNIKMEMHQIKNEPSLGT